MEDHDEDDLSIEIEDRYDEDDYDEDEDEDEADSHSEMRTGWNPEQYALVIAGQLGVAVQDFMPTLGEKVLACASAIEVNKLVVAWYGARPEAHAPTPAVLDDKDLAMLKALVSPANTAKARSLARIVEDCRNYAISYGVEQANALKKMGEAQGELDVYLRSEGTDLAAEIRSITADGWYTYDSEASQYMDRLVFRTQEVTLTYFNTQAGIEMAVPMGRYTVVIGTTNRTISVNCYRDNIHITTPHPHVMGGSEGVPYGIDSSVCWGNAHETYVDGMKTLAIAKVLTALRSLLCSYNEESPYVTLLQYHAKASPHLLTKEDVKYQRYGTRCGWVPTKVLPYSLLEEPLSVAAVGTVQRSAIGNTMKGPTALVPIHRLLKAGTQERLDSRHYYVAMKGGRYWQIQDIDVLAWGEETGGTGE